eukprot:6202658-Pleurochrysis_carterae.AAC.1
MRAVYSSFMRLIQSSPSRGPALIESIGSFCTVALVAASTPALAARESERARWGPNASEGGGRDFSNQASE